VQGRRRRLEVLEREQAEAARRAAADERLRIAQELHDVVAHSLGVIAVQAGVGLHTIDVEPAEARQALEHISRTSRTSLAEIRRLLGMVRSREGGAGYDPARGLKDLPRLVQDMAASGLPVDLRVDGDTGGVPPGLELAAYRIVQESLTNSLRHARASRAAVHLCSDPGVLRVEVTDDGVGAGGPAGAGPGPGGHGLVGMRERVALYGGSLEAGPRTDGGFGVAVTLPYDLPSDPPFDRPADAEPVA
jgi:signal transduction histidine kinase